MALTASPPTRFLSQGQTKTTMSQWHREELKQKSQFADWFPAPLTSQPTPPLNGPYIRKMPVVHLEGSRHQLKQTFDDLVQTWRKDTGHLSSTLHRVTHPAYQRIIGLGPQALPLILRELKARPDFWFWALRAISGEDPSKPQDDLDGVVNAWLKWGVERGYVSGD